MVGMRPSFAAVCPHGVVRWFSLVASLALLIATLGPACAADPWLFVNDVHFKPSRDPRPSRRGSDTNAALLASSLNEMRRVAPNPPVIVMAGDFLGHHFRNADATPTMIALAKRFNGVFPHAQFVIALGNEDSDCGDYAVAANSAFLRAVATAWEPLVNRNGAAPDFVRTFSRDGFYTARLPVAGVRAVVVNDAFWSPLYHNACGSHGSPTPESFGELDAALRPVPGERRWLVMHIPPGIDVSSTLHLARHLVIVPFLRPQPRDRVLQLAGDPARHVEVVITGHMHRFAYRIIDPSGPAPVPLLVAPAISPIYGNSPSFLTADVASDGVIQNLEEHSLVHGEWRDIGGLSTLGASEFSGRALLNLQRRLEQHADEREKFAMLYSGGAPWSEVNETNWRSYWCVATEFNATAFRDCLDEGGFSFLTRRGVAVVALAIAGVVALTGALIALIVAAVRRRRARA
jgi:sphingomyelin phosphodiesterase acid-like 3